MKLNLRLVRLFGIGMLLTILSFTMLQAQPTAPWRAIGPWGGNITDIKFKFINDSGLVTAGMADSVIVASYGSGIFITGGLCEGPGGAAVIDWTAPNSIVWEPRNNGLPSLKVLSLASRKIGQGDTMYAGLDGYGVYKTVNAGRKWERAFGLGTEMGKKSVYDIAIHPNTSWVAYAATSEGLWKTTNFGVTWEPVMGRGTTFATTGVWNNVQMHEFTTQKIYATSGGQLYRSTNMGASWGGPYSVNGTAEITAIALAFSALDTIYAGCSDGTVKEITFPVPLPNGPGWYPGATEGVFTVVDKSRGLIPGNKVTDMAIIQTYSAAKDTIIGNDTIYMTTSNGVFKSDKKGNVWTQVNVGLSSTNGSAVAVYAMHDNYYYPGSLGALGDSIRITLYHHVFVGTTLGGLYHTQTDKVVGAAVKWDPINYGIPTAGLRAVSVTATSSETVYAGGGYIMGNGLASGVLYKTSTASNTSPVWEIVYPPATSADGLYVMDISTDWADKGYVMVADSILGLIKSIDSGQTFTVIPNTASATAVCINRMRYDTMFAGRGNGELLRSYDAFQTFDVVQRFGYPITDIVMDSAHESRTQTLYVATLGGGVYKSTDLGTTFKQLNIGTSNYMVYSVSVDTNYVVIGTEFGAYHSTDHGETWYDKNLGAPPYAMDDVTGVYTVRQDTVWSVLLNETPMRNLGIFYDGAIAIESYWEHIPDYTPSAGEVPDGFPSFEDDGTGTLVAHDFVADGPVQSPLLMRDIDMMWKWDGPGVDGSGNGSFDGLAIAGYAVSEAWGVFARNNTGFGSINNGITNTVNVTTQTDSIFVWIPDTLSALRGNPATIGENYFDIPIFVKNIQRADSLTIAVNIPSAYFNLTFGTNSVYSTTYPLPTGKIYPIITEGTVTQGFTIIADEDRPTNGNVAGYISWGGGLGDNPDSCNMVITPGDTTVFHIVSNRGSFRSDREELFRIRVNIIELATAYTLDDSTPRATATSTYADNLKTDIMLLSLGTADPAQGSRLDKLTQFFQRRADGFIPITQAKFADPSYTVAGGTPVDSTAVFWFRRYPGGGLYDANNDLKGGLTIGTTLSDTIVSRGEIGSGYNGALATTANYTNDNKWSSYWNTGGSMTVGIAANSAITYPYLTYTGFPELPIRTGDALGAFYYRNDSLVCGGWGIYDPTGFGFNIQRDDDRTAIKDGFVENEKVYFKIYDSRYKKVWDVEEITYVGDSVYRGGGLIQITGLKAKNYISAPIVLHAGWNLISAPIIPRWPEMETIFKAPVATNHLTLVKDENGLVYWPGIDLNQLPYWNIDEAYWVYMYQVDDSDPDNNVMGDTVMMQGATIDLDNYSISLRAGWNLLPYWGTKTAPTSVLAPLVAADRNLILKDGETKALYLPGYNFDDIDSLKPGRGYELYLNVAYPEFKYPSSVQYKIGSMDNGISIPGLMLEKKVAPMYNPVATTPISQVIIFKVRGYKLQEGDEIGIFTRDGACVGSSKFGGSENVIAVSVFGSAPVFEETKKVGAIEGDELIVRFYSRTDGQEYTPAINNVEWIHGSGSGLFFKAGTIASADAVVLDAPDEVLALPTEFAIAQNYPNPFNPTTNIKYQLPVDGFVKIKIFDMLGKEIKTLVNQDQKAGYYTLEWDATNNSGRKAASGVYFYQIEASNFKKTMKMMLMK